MDEALLVIEIEDSYVKFTYGNVSDGKPYITYVTKKPIGGMVARGEIIDFDRLSQSVASFHCFKDKDANISFSGSNAIIVVPPLGFQIFECEKTTNVVSSTGIIDQIDIKNAESLVRKQQVPPGSEIVDIVPDYFRLEDNSKHLTPPIGQKSNSITVKTKVFTLPTNTFDSYMEVIRNTPFKAKRTLIAPYCEIEYIKSLENSPKSFVLVDMNRGYSSITLVGGGSIYNSKHFLLGYNDLILRLVTSFGISEKEAEEALDTYGINNKDIGFEPIIINSKDEYGREKNYTQSDLNSVIEEFLNEYFTQFDASYNALVTGYAEKVKSLPYIFVGPLSSLRGIDKLINSRYTDCDKNIFLSSKVVGNRGADELVSAGALLICSKYRGTLSEDRSKISQLSRVNTENKK